jgi:hypothetical protein
VERLQEKIHKAINNESRKKKVWSWFALLYWNFCVGKDFVFFLACLARDQEPLIRGLQT